MEQEEGVYCTTAGQIFSEREALQEHYHSEFHRYNLKRKVAGLPPVTKEWYDARKTQIEAASSRSLQKIWYDPLAKRKFSSENTYNAFIRSKKYTDMVKKSGKPAPEPVITLKQEDGPERLVQHKTKKSTSLTESGATLKPIAGSSMSQLVKEEGLEKEDEEMSDWETASEEDEELDPSQWEKWDVCRSLFDNHTSMSMELNLEYMWKKYGFYLPDSQYLADPEGLLQYLGAKMRYGKLPLYESGLNPDAKRMRSLHGVQRHMIDSGKCKMLYEGNEDEYEDYYDYGEEMEEDGGQALVVSEDAALLAGTGYELAIPTSQDSNAVKLIGSREFSRYYRQRHRNMDMRASAMAARVISKYRQLTVPLLGDGTEAGIARAQKKIEEKCRDRVNKVRLAASLRRNVNDNLPKNVPY